MTFDINEWGLPLAVLGAGLAVGAGLAFSSRRNDAEDRAVSAAGQEADLVATKNAVVEALQALETERGKLTPEEYDKQRKALVARGAAALRTLDGADEPEQAPVPAPTLDAAFVEQLKAERARLGDDRFQKALADATGMALQQQRSWGGVATLAVLALVALGLWFTAANDATDRGENGSLTGRQPGAATPSAPPASPPGPSQAELEARVAANPADIEALNELTERAIAHEKLDDAMSWNAKAREVDPQDHDARVNRAALQVAIGMSDRAMALLDEVLAEDPRHHKAHVYRGLLAMRAQDWPTAVKSFESAIEIGGPDPFLQQRLAQARAGGSPASTAAPAPPAQGEVLVQGTVSLADGISMAGNEILFIAVIDPARPGPPLAPKKVERPKFPYAFQITSADLLPMHRGKPLPDTLVVSLQLDRDGNAMTKDDNLAVAKISDVARGTGDLVLELK